MKLGYFVCSIALAGCASVDPNQSGSGLDDGAVETTGKISLPVATIELAGGRQLEFYESGPEMAVVQRYNIGESPILGEADEDLTAPELYRKYAAVSKLPAAFSAAVARAKDEAAKARIAARDEDAPNELEAAVDVNESGGGSPAPRDGATGVGRLNQALSQGDGCNPYQSNVVFSDCRWHWYGGYWAYGVATWNLDSRVEAVYGSLDAKFTSKYAGVTRYSTVHLNQGQVSDLTWRRVEVCTEFLGIPVDCDWYKVQRRLDVINAATTTFNVDVVFFN